MVGAITQNLNILSFPDEILLSVMGFVGPKDLCNLALMNRRFRVLSNDCSLWPTQSQLITNMALEEIKANPKQAYLQNSRTHRNLEQGRYKTTTIFLQPTYMLSCFAILGNKVVSGSGDCTVRVWDLGSLGSPTVLRGHEGWVIAIAADGNKVVSGSLDCTVRVWDLGDLENPTVLQGHEDAVSAVAILGDKIISGSLDCTVRVWDLGDLENPTVLRGHTKNISAVATLGDKIISASSDYTVRVWDLGDLGNPTVLRGHASEVSDLAILGDKIVSGSWDRTIRVWDLGDLENPRVLGKHDSLVNGIAIFGDKVVSGTYDCTMRVWNVETSKSVVLNLDSQVLSLAVQGSRILAWLETSIVVYDFLADLH